MAVLASRELRDELVDLNETRKAVENAENRARLEQKKSETRLARKNDREFAQALHRQADQLYHSGDYETALVLYHRAANLFPRDSSHSVAARRAAATISSCNNPPKALRRILPNARTEERLTASLCPETAATQANDRLKKSPSPASVVEVLSYFDDHKSFWKLTPSPRVSNTQVSRCKMMFRQLNNLAEATLKNLQVSFNSGKISAALKISEELLVLSEGLQDPSRYQIAAYHYLSLIHVALGRHDRAVCGVSRLVRLSKSTGDVVQICRSLVTLGKVHLSFGHLEAAARSWQHLSKDLKDPIPVAWIRHEIGRCCLETGKHRQALEMASRCVEAAVEGNCKKWILHGKLLQGQSLAKLGRFVESMDELKIAATITEDEGDTPMLSYIRDLIDQVSRALRRISFENWGPPEGSRTPSSRLETEDDATRQSIPRAGRAETVITTMFYQRQVIAEYHDGGSSTEDSMDEQITMHSEKTVRRYRSASSRTDFEEEQGGSTSRADSLERKRDTSSSSNFSTPSSSSFNDRERTGKSVEGNSEGDRLKIRNAEEDQDNFKQESRTSLKSTNTTATYVIASGSVLKRAKRGSKDAEEKGISRVADKAREETSSDKTLKEEENMLNGIREIEQLKKKDEAVDLLRYMLLNDEDRSHDLDSGDAEEYLEETSRR